jgi:hypothetical protein
MLIDVTFTKSFWNERASSDRRSGNVEQNITAFKVCICHTRVDVFSNESNIVKV